MKIVFMGTPDFAVESLKILVESNCNVVGVVTSPDKPAGRGLEIQQSAVKHYAEKVGLRILQPEKLKDELFLSELKKLNADLQVVVAFRMLPEIVWQMPRLGTFNLHASLLPQYRGAAPINWAIINGEKETGVTTFFLQHEIDTGKIIFRETIPINENDDAGIIHDKLMKIGADLVLKTVLAIKSGSYPQQDQSAFILTNAELKHAPKIFKNDCKISWTNNAHQVHNQIRGLSPYPAAFTNFVSPDGKIFQVKIFRTEKIIAEGDTQIYTDSKNYLYVKCTDAYLSIAELQLSGKKRMHVVDFLRGFKIDNTWTVE